MLHPYGMVNLSISLSILLIGGIVNVFKFIYKNPVYFAIPIFILFGISLGIEYEVIPIGKIYQDIENSFVVTQSYAISTAAYEEIKENEKINTGVIELGAASQEVFDKTENFIESEEFQTAWNGDNSIFKKYAIDVRDRIAEGSETTIEFIKSQCYLKASSDTKVKFIGYSSDNCFLEIEMNS